MDSPSLQPTKRPGLTSIVTSVHFAAVAVMEGTCLRRNRQLFLKSRSLPRLPEPTPASSGQHQARLASCTFAHIQTTQTLPTWYVAVHDFSILLLRANTAVIHRLQPAPASASASTLASIESGHTDMVHDCQLDWYGRRLATCSSDRTVKIFDVEEGSGGAQGSTAGGAGSQVLLDTLRGHDGPVWAVAWGHPKFGSILASAGYDGKVFVWREIIQGQQQQQQQSYGQPQTQNARWERIKEHGLHGASGKLVHDDLTCWRQ